VEDNYLGSITIRIDIEFLKRLDMKCGKKHGNKFKDRSEGVRFYIERGEQFESLLEIYNDPKKKAEFESKLSGIAKEKDLEKYLQTIDDPAFLNSIIFIAQNIKEAKVKQMILNVKQS
jgi:hypothetical protein